MTILRLVLALLLTALSLISRAEVVVTDWKPLFKGIERAVGTNFANSPAIIYTNNNIVYTNGRLQVVNCVRVDLTDPDVQFFTTPRASNYVAELRETYSQTVSNFLQVNGLQVAINANFYNTAVGYDPITNGVASQVYGLQICTGSVVSVPDYGPDSNNRSVSMLFTANKSPFLVLANGPPGTNTEGIYTSISGYYPVLTNGVILGEALRTLYPDSTIHDIHPRTVFGLSENRRYLYLMIIDGRQGAAQFTDQTYSDGATDADMGFWLLQFGASDGINMDGGGSSSMYMADCAARPMPLGHSSYTSYHYERNIGSHFGVYAPPVPSFINSVSAAPGSVNATITWNTIAPASSQVEYGTTTNFGSLSPVNPTPATNHAVLLNNLNPLTRYYFRAISIVGSNVFSYTCPGTPFQTTNFAGGVLFPITNTWRYSTANLDGVSWKIPSYNDSAWSNSRAALWSHDGV